MKEELIGKHAKIMSNNMVFDGIIIDETKNMISIKTEDGKKKVIKKTSKIDISGKTIYGNKITKRPEERIKSC